MCFDLLIKRVVFDSETFVVDPVHALTLRIGLNIALEYLAIKQLHVNVILSLLFVRFVQTLVLQSTKLSELALKFFEHVFDHKFVDAREQKSDRLESSGFVSDFVIQTLERVLNYRFGVQQKYHIPHIFIVGFLGRELMARFEAFLAQFED